MLVKTDLPLIESKTELPTIEHLDHKVVIFCIDGLSPDILDKYMEEYDSGLFSNVARNGIYSNMATIYPTHSPVIWTSVATGELPINHGIIGFGRYRFFYGDSVGFSAFPRYCGLSKYFYLISKTGLVEFQPNLSTHIKVPMIWDILSNAGYSLHVINYPVSLPPSEINGIFLSETEFVIHFTDILYENIYPPDLKDHIQTTCEKLETKGTSIFDNQFDILLKDRDIYSKRLAKRFFVNDYKILNLALELLKDYQSTHKSNIDIIYSHGLDASTHLFYKDFYSDLENGLSISDTYLGNYMNFIEDTLSRYITEIDEEYTVFIMSDHGFHAKGILESITNLFKQHLQGIHESAPEGVFMAFGKDIVRNESIDKPSVYDIAPTLLYHLNLPVSKDFPGGALDIFEKANPVLEIDSYRGSTKEFYIREIMIKDEDLTTHESVLKSLGYIN